MKDIYDFAFPVINLGDDILLEEINTSYNVDFYNYLNHENVRGFLSEGDLPSSETSATMELGYWQSLFRTKKSIYWSIMDKKANKMIGSCGYNHWSRVHNRVEISYDLDYDYWGKGIMTTALRRITNFAFVKMKVIRIQATVSTENEKSIKLLERVGFNREGIMGKYAVLHDREHDCYMYGFIKN